MKHTASNYNPIFTYKESSVRHQMSLLRQRLLTKVNIALTLVILVAGIVQIVLMVRGH